MIVVSDTSAILNLAVIGRLELLQALYQTILIPQAVYLEITADALLPGATDVSNAKWITVRQVTNTVAVMALQTELDAGEAEAIILADEVKADWLLMDEALGRNVAQRFGLRFIGLLGVLLQAKRAGLVTEVKVVLDELQTRAGFWISRDLYTRILQQAGEAVK